VRGKLAQLGALPARDRRPLAEAFVVLPAVVLAVRWLSVRRVAALIAPTPPTAAGRAEAVVRARRLAQLMMIAVRHGVLAGNCLSRSFALCWLLRRERIAGELRIGVRRDAGTLLAHAWVEVAGEPINDRPDVREWYSAFDRDLLGAIAGWA
jgi:hypothetical protein